MLCAGCDFLENYSDVLSLAHDFLDNYNDVLRVGRDFPENYSGVLRVGRGALAGLYMTRYDQI